MVPFDVDAIDLHTLRRRQSAKYQAFAPDVIPAWVAEMDFPLAEPIADALHEAIDRSDTGYQSGAGLADAVTGFLHRSWSWKVQQSRVFDISDVLSGVNWAIRLLSRPGDGVVVNTPVYPPFFSTIRDIAERQVVDVPLTRSPNGEYALDMAGLEAAFAQPEVTAYVLCSPHNPTGTVPTRGELEQISELAHTHGVAVIADEIHAPLTLPGAVHTPFLTVAPEDATCVSLVSASKAWNLPGLKCAQMIGTERTATTIRERLPKEVLYGSGHLGVIASVAAYESGGPWLEHVVSVIDTNRSLVAELLAEHVPQASYVPPAASYLAWIDLSAYDVGPDPSTILLDEGRIAVNAGPTFGAGGDGHVRLNMATSPAILTEVVERMGRSLGSARQHGAMGQ